MSKKTCICPKHSHLGLYELRITDPHCPEHGTAGECTCSPRDKVYWPSGHEPGCPENPRGTQEMFEDSPIPLELREKCSICGVLVNIRLHGSPKFRCSKCLSTPDLPLHVRVAKVLGKEPYFGNGEWYCRHPLSPPVGIGGTIIDQQSFEVCKVKDYLNDLVAAMGALEEYCAHKNCYGTITIHKKLSPNDWNYFCEIKECGIGPGLRWEIKKGGILPQAICEAIVSHSEGK